MTAAVTATLEVARQTAALILRQRMLIAIAVISVLALAAVVYGVAGEVAAELRGDELFGIVAATIYMSLGVPVFALYIGVVAVHGEIEDGSLSYLLVRPIRRGSLFLGKWVGVVAVGIPAAGGTLAVLWLSLALGGHDWLEGVGPSAAVLAAFAAAAAMAVAAYAAVACALGALVRRPLIAAVAFLMGWELLASHTPPQAGIRGATVADPIRRWLLEVLQPTGELRGALLRGLDPVWLQPDGLGDPVRSLAWFTALALGAGLWAYCRREYDSRPRE